MNNSLRKTQSTNASAQQSIKIIAEMIVNMGILGRIKFSNQLKVSTSEIIYYS